MHLVKMISKTLSRAMRRMLRRQAAIEHVIGHLKSDCRMDRIHLKGAEGDRINAILSGAGYNLRKLLRWIVIVVVRLLMWAIEGLSSCRNMSNRAYR